MIWGITLLVMGYIALDITAAHAVIGGIVIFSMLMLPLIVVGSIIFAIAFLLIRRFRKFCSVWPNLPVFGLLISLIWVIGLGGLTIFFSNSSYIASIQVNDHLYYLIRQSGSDDLPYATLYECTPAGLFCTSLFKNEENWDWYKEFQIELLQLVTDDNKQELTIMHGQKALYTYSLPR